MTPSIHGFPFPVSSLTARCSAMSGLMPQRLASASRCLVTSGSLRYHQLSIRFAHNMRQLSIGDLNPAVLNVQYAVRGELAIKADEHKSKLESGDHDLPFNRIINSNIGNPQQKGLDQPPITFARQVSHVASVLHILHWKLNDI